MAPGIPAVAPLTPAISILTASNTTISGTVLLKVDRSATPTSDQLAAPSVLATVGSRLIVTNLGATNYSLTTGLSTNWHEFAGTTSTNQVTVPMASDAGAIFFRLLYP